MKSRDFCYWLQGFFEITSADPRAMPDLTSAQVQMIKQHLAMVFRHEIDPGMGSAAHQAELTDIHQGEMPPRLAGDTSLRSMQEPPLGEAPTIPGKLLDRREPLIPGELPERKAPLIPGGEPRVVGKDICGELECKPGCGLHEVKFNC